LRALRHRNFQLFFSGQLISLVGTWMQSVAQAWLVYRITKSSLQLGAVGFASQIPVFLVAPLGGTIADRLNRHRLVIATQASSMILAAILAWLTLSGRIEIWHIYVLAILLGVVNAFDIPARQSFLVDMVGKEDLMNAIALNSSMFNGARVVGPAIAGIMLIRFGEGWCFAANSISYIAVIIGLLFMKVHGQPRSTKTSPLEDIAEGFRWVNSTKIIRALLLLIGLISLVGMPYTVLMPAFVDHVIHGGPNTLGVLMAATGIGALAGGMYLAGRQSVVGLGRVVMVSTLVFGAALIAFAFAGSLRIAVAVLPIVGGAFMVQMAATNTVLQTLVDDRLRGRVMAFYTMAFFGTAPIGSLLAGILADRIGARWTIAAGGAIVIAAGLWFAARLPALRAIVRPIYVERGILPVPAVDAGTKTL